MSGMKALVSRFARYVDFLVTVGPPFRVPDGPTAMFFHVPFHAELVVYKLADTDGSSVIPPSVLRVLNSKACRGAIMFGDGLLPSECSLTVEELKQTSMCFQCAHGRPTTAPLVNLVVLHKQIAKLGNWSHGSSVMWHGLSRHRPTLERAVQCLSSE